MHPHPDIQFSKHRAFSEMPLELRKHVLKLRWIGADEEAERLRARLQEKWPTLPVISAPETD